MITQHILNLHALATHLEAMGNWYSAEVVREMILDEVKMMKCSNDK